MNTSSVTGCESANTNSLHYLDIVFSPLALVKGHQRTTVSGGVPGLGPRPGSELCRGICLVTDARETRAMAEVYREQLTQTKQLCH